MTVEPVQRLAQYKSPGQYKFKCPYCQRTRKRNRHDKPLSVRIDSKGGQYRCWHCDTEGGWMNDKTFDDFDIDSLKESRGTEIKTYLLDRGIKESVIEEYTMSGSYRFNGSSVPAIGFPYTNNAVKWRSADSKKRFSQQNVCEDFFLLDRYKDGQSILICEGELDALAWLSADLPDDICVFSVPNGAPNKVSDGRPDPSEDRRFRYVWRAKEALEAAPRIYLNTDADGPGHALAEELARRIGRSKIWLVDLAGPKDAAAALQEHDAHYLVDRLHNSQPIPLVGLYVADDFTEDFHNLYQHGQLRGAEIGINGIDRLVCVPLGMLTIMTGFPGSGKSDILDQICFNMAKNYGWKTVFCSFEKPPAMHMAQLSQKYHKKPFFGPERMTTDEAEIAHNWINEHFMFIDPSNKGPSDIDGILDAASAAVMRMGCRVLVIDNYDYIDSDRSTDAVSSILSKARAWARQHEAHVFFVAHPTKVYEYGKHVCSGRDISGSASWFNKADLGITMWRCPEDRNPPEFHVWKVRWSWMGRLGHARLNHDPNIGSWEDHLYVPDDYDWDF